MLGKFVVPKLQEHCLGVPKFWQKNLIGLLFLGIFNEKHTIVIWCMWGKKVIGKYLHEKRKNFSAKTHNPNKCKLLFSIIKGVNHSSSNVL